MVCPGCQRSVSERQLLKFNVRGFRDVPVIYDAVCPYCALELGRMAWGELTPNEGVQVRAAERDGDKRAPREPAQEPRQRYLCPHCGEALPDDLKAYPIHALSERSGDRRQDDRRKRQIYRLSPDRRAADRRTGERRYIPPSPDRRAGDRRRIDVPVFHDRRSGHDRRGDAPEHMEEES